MGISIWIVLIDVSPIQSTTSFDERVRANLALCITQDAGKTANAIMDYYCKNNVLLPTINCRHFTKSMSNKWNAIFPKLYFYIDMTVKTFTFQSVVSSMYKALSIYSVLLKNYKQREYEVLCARAMCFEKPCPYPEACSKETPPSDGIHYCYLRKASDCMTELVNQLSEEMTSKDDPMETLIVDETLLIPRFTSEIHRQLYIMATVQRLVEDLNTAEYALEYLLS
ncbi:uncharacterized protein LOC106873702 isoform X2 [Octopus bimaculoides]|uniref:uncharacterized protein LOC106873702 isoform X2 n=1 Tax=Octopus bimaculoides TaxID=37653 RepID=UPI0022E4307C|nr:uncharacterized protein LOC106873702 isoform X2 [Octopus bimaculoides]